MSSDDYILVLRTRNTAGAKEFRIAHGFDSDDRLPIHGLLRSPIYTRLKDALKAAHKANEDWSAYGSTEYGVQVVRRKASFAQILLEAYKERLAHPEDYDFTNSNRVLPVFGFDPKRWTKPELAAIERWLYAIQRRAWHSCSEQHLPRIGHLRFAHVADPVELAAFQYIRTQNDSVSLEESVTVLQEDGSSTKLLFGVTTY